jgi:hypothetical protein
VNRTAPPVSAATRKIPRYSLSMTP